MEGGQGGYGDYNHKAPKKILTNTDHEGAVGDRSHRHEGAPLLILHEGGEGKEHREQASLYVLSPAGGLWRDGKFLWKTFFEGQSCDGVPFTASFFLNSVFEGGGQIPHPRLGLTRLLPKTDDPNQRAHF